MIRIEGLRKHYPGRGADAVTALDGLTLSARRGEIYALLGPNGSGKTTTLRILSTLVRPSTGDAWIDGRSVVAEPAEVRRRFAMVSEDTAVYERMTPREIGWFFGRLHGLADAAIDRNLQLATTRLDMASFLDRRTETFSTGMRQKTALLRALVLAPQVLLFDEPSAGLDVLAARGMMQHLQDLRAEGTTVLFTTHVLWEAEKLADRIGILYRGRLLLEGSLDELRQRSQQRDLEDIFFALVEQGGAAAA